MPLLKAGRLVEDPWRVVDDAAPLSASEPVIVSLARFQAERQTLLERWAPLGVKLRNSDAIDALAGVVNRFAVIALEFPKFSDGRAYSQARGLRERLGFAGELRATGDVLIDQALFMRRCGFDAYEIAEAARAPRFVEAFRTFSVFYQPAGDGSAPVAALRRYASAA
ncbi:MAG: DUF934 domain-containing protein [Alphaproteobacteria bacterium]|nr:DUF934 domain-containing protein [Alphaproteobacteria bacterium]MCW5741988.1 DUF934 domain-containing protein [Alphaproteobacteria bacterium]